MSETSQTVRSPAPAGRGLGGFLCRYEAGGANAQPHFAAASIAPWLKLDGLGTSFEYGHVPPPPLARDPDPLTQGSPLPDSESRFGIRRCQALVLKTACCNRKGLAPSPNEGTSRSGKPCSSADARCLASDHFCLDPQNACLNPGHLCLDPENSCLDPQNSCLDPKNPCLDNDNACFENEDECFENDSE